MDDTKQEGRDHLQIKENNPRLNYEQLPDKMEAMYRPWQVVETKTCWTSKTLNVLWHQKVKNLVSDFSLAWKKHFITQTQILFSERAWIATLHYCRSWCRSQHSNDFHLLYYRNSNSIFIWNKNIKAQLHNALQCGSWLTSSLSSLEERYRT